MFENLKLNLIVGTDSQWKRKKLRQEPQIDWKQKDGWNGVTEWILY